MAGLFTPNSGSGGGYGTIGAGKGQLGEIGHPLLQSGRQMRTMQNAATARNRGFEEQKQPTGVWMNTSHTWNLAEECVCRSETLR